MTRASSGKKPSSPAPASFLQLGPEDIERLLEQLYRVVFEFSQNLGITESAAKRLHRRAFGASRRAPYRISEAVNFQSMLQLSDILDAWHRDPDWVTDTGDPRPLSLAGPMSFETLAQRFLPSIQVKTLAPALIAEGVLNQHLDGTVTPVRRAAAFARANPWMLDRIPVLVKALLDTCSHNLDPDTRRTGTRCDRGTTIEDLPEEMVPIFNGIAKDLTQVLLNKVDAWAEPYRVPQDRRGKHKLARVGVQVFSWVDVPAPRRRPTK